MKACKYGDCADHYGDSAAWCDKCKAAQQQEQPDSAATAGAGLVAALTRQAEGAEYHASTGMAGFAARARAWWGAVRIAEPYDAELVSLRALLGEWVEHYGLRASFRADSDLMVRTAAALKAKKGS